MSFASYHHGTRLQESSETPVLVQVSQSAVVGLIGTAPDADAAVFPLNVPVLLPGSPALAASLGAAGTLKDAVDDVFDQGAAMVVVLRIEEGADAAETLSHAVGDAATLTGIHALKKAQSLLGITPRLIAAPGFTESDGDMANPLVAEMAGVLEDLRAVGFVDGPDTSDAAAIAARGLISSARIYLVDPKVMVWDTEANTYVARPASARFAGVQARVDTERGFWHSLSNKPINGIGGASRTVLYGAQANHLNENHVGTVLNMGSGFLTWGNRGCTDDTLWAFLSVRRTADFINGALERAYMGFVDRPFSAANLKLMLESGNAALRTFKAQGAIIGGRVWLDEALNAPDQLAAGKVRLSVDFEPPAPMEDIGLTVHRNIQYYMDLTKEALAAAA